MTTTRISRDDKRIVIVCNDYTEGTLKELEKHLKYGLVRSEDYTSATLNYDCDKGCPIATCEGAIDLPESYPLRFKGANSEVWCSAVTAGYRGEGPHGALRCLEMMGFILSEEEQEHLFSDKKARLVFEK